MDSRAEVGSIDEQRVFLVVYGIESDVDPSPQYPEVLALDDVGRAEALDLAETLDYVRPRLVLTCPHPRALQTATVIAGRIGLRPTIMSSTSAPYEDGLLAWLSGHVSEGGTGPVVLVADPDLGERILRRVGRPAAQITGRRSATWSMLACRGGRWTVVEADQRTDYARQPSE